MVSVRPYDLSVDFSTNANPNGVWSYGSKTAAAGAFTVSTNLAVSHAENGVPLQYWSPGAGNRAGCLFQWHHPNSDRGPGAGDPAAGHGADQRLVAHVGGEIRGGPVHRPRRGRRSIPGGNLGRAIRRWLLAGEHRLSRGQAWRGTEVFGQALPAGASTGYTNVLDLAAGETVDFVVGPGQGDSKFKALKVTARLTLLGTAPVKPVILAGPQSQTVQEGQPASFSVQASGTEPLTYRWLFQGGALADETNPTLNLAQVRQDQAGGYQVVVANDHGSATSEVAVLTVTTAPMAVHDIAADFSTNANPSGVWSYGWKPAAAGAFNVSTNFAVSPAENGVPMQYWSPAPGTEPAVYFNGTTQTAIAGLGQATLPPGTVQINAWSPTAVERYGAVRFTVPAGAAGRYRVETSVAPFADGSHQGTTDYHVIKDDAELFGQALPAGASAGYTNVLDLAAGETVDFVVGPGQGDGKFKALKVVARVTLVGVRPYDLSA